MKLRVTARFFGKICFAPKMGKIEFFSNLLKSRLFLFIYFLNVLYNESLYCLMRSYTNPVFGKNLVPEI